MPRDIHDEARDKWPSILVSCGIDESFLRNRHGPCPSCNGKDRFRFDNQRGKGTFFCSSCGSGSGIDLLMLVNGISFKDAVKLVREKLPGSYIQNSKQTAGKEDSSKAIKTIWSESKPLSVNDESWKYLCGRGFPADKFSSDALHTHRGLKYWIDLKKSLGPFPAMIAQITDGAGKMVGLHRTYLNDGKKAAVDMPKKTLGKLDASSAIRLYPATEVLGVAEGIETAIAAHRIYKIPFWALISAGQMERFEWPKSVRRLIVCGDNDRSFTGQKSAFALAHRAAMKGLEVECLIPDEVGTDFADVKW